ncbi:MAG TPA: hypothetical protein PLE72_05015 [Azospira sp.]|uniref:hypothetical protein n=1 Tax=Pseudomonadota TaxID=1224 RepID=UPI002C9A2026|nr:hypothetical protein [Accumulibacter sp.]HMU31198.1 hypothetical protein [Nitrospira sp.]HNG16724.1 hypothetical protein [Accumulibacter sp.]HNJ76105.1 hypothetical protein [Azospira sp.]HNN45219.1 hypothetical protein [Azospira sp.]
MRIERWYTQPKASEFASLALGLKRQRRSELRESVVSITRALLHFLDLATLRVAAFDYANDRACALQIRYLAGIAQLSESRAQRALLHLRDAGLLTTHQRAVADEEMPSGWRGLAAVRTISRKLFVMLGLEVALERERKKASKRVRQIQAEARSRAAAPRGVKASIEPLRSQTRRNRRTDTPSAGSAQSIDARRQWHARAAELAVQGLNTAQIREALGPPPD